MTRSPTRVVTPLPSSPRRPALSLVAAGVALAIGTFGIDAAALSLGRLNVLSSLGEPLRAEVELSDLTAAEADGLRVRIPSSDAFRAIGVPYNTALADVQATVQRRANGRYVVQLSSSRQMADPFIDVLLEANGSSGRVFRDYTVLIDPPGARPVAPPPTASPSRQASVPGSDRAAPSSAFESRPRPAAVPVQRPAASASSMAPAPAAPVERSAPAPSRSAGGGSDRQITVRPGDTASRIANSVKPAEISLDQMLIALLRVNPDAFTEGNLNRVRAGAVMEVPDASQAGALSPQDARRAVIAQSRDFGDYRRQLAENAPVASAAQSGRQTSGRLQADVQTRTPVAPADRLTVAPGGVVPAPATAIAPQTGAGGATPSSSGTSATANGVPAGAAGAVAPGAIGAASAPVAASASAVPPAAVAASGANVASSGATAPVAAVVPPAPMSSDAAGVGTGAVAVPAPTSSTPTVRASVPAAAVAPEPDEAWYDAILTNPLALGGLGLIGLLIAWLALRLNSRRRRDSADSVFLESNAPRDSFFAASGGESVDTRNRGGALASSLSYSPSHVDAADVDPVAEADVYLAYGRDLQAEEILREALKAHPERVAIHVKLLEIHAKRRDVRAYEALTHDVNALTGGTGSDWTRVLEMGRELDPGNPAYATGGGRSGGMAAAAALAAAAAAAESIRAPAPSALAFEPMPFAPEPVSALPPVFTSQAPAFVPSVAPLDFDLDLEQPDPVTPTTPPAAAQTATPPPARKPVDPMQPPLDTTMPMPLEIASEPSPPHNPFLSTMPHPPLDGGADHPLTIDLADFDTTPAALETRAAPLSPSEESESEYATLRADLPADSGLIDFDVRDLSQTRTPAAADTVRAGFGAQRHVDGNPQAIKLSLARELQAMGDLEGARSLIEEVESESSGDLREQARRMLSQLG